MCRWSDHGNKQSLGTLLNENLRAHRYKLDFHDTYCQSLLARQFMSLTSDNKEHYHSFESRQTWSSVTLLVCMTLDDLERYGVSLKTYYAPQVADAQTNVAIK